MCEKNVRVLDGLEAWYWKPAKCLLRLEVGSVHEKNRKSRLGIIIWYGDATIYTASRLQKTISLSSTEAEFTALREGCTSIIWLRTVLN